MNKSRKPTYLYHYTTDEGFTGILETHEPRATSIFCLNDWKEFSHGRSELTAEIERRPACATMDTRKKEVLQEVVRLLEPAHPLCENVFICSFSAARNGDDLSQWRAYCRNGGLSLGFRRDNLEFLSLGHRSIQCIHSSYHRNGFHVHRCRYRKGCRDQADDLLSFYRRARGEEDQRIVTQVAALLLGHFIAAHKHPGFADECEWRLVYVGTKPEQKFRMRGVSLVPYVTFCLHDKDLWKGAQITLSPGSAPERMASVKRFLRHVLHEHGLPTACVGSVSYSGVPYRT
jgi:hypothetical protein